MIGGAGIVMVQLLAKEGEKMDKPFFTAEDLNPWEGPLTPGFKTPMDFILQKANAKVAPLIAENERLKDANCWSCEDKEKIRKLTEQNRELESIVSKRVPKLEKILSIMTEQNRILQEKLSKYETSQSKKD